MAFAGLLALALLAADSNGAEPPIKLAVLPTQFDASAVDLPVSVFDDMVLSVVSQVTHQEVIGRDDIDTLLGFDKEKAMAGCDDTSCFAELGGALGVDKLVALRVAKVDDEWAVTAKLIDIRRTRVESRSSEFVRGSGTDLLRAMPRIVTNLFEGGGISFAAPVAPIAPAASVAPQSPAAPADPPPSLPTAPAFAQIMQESGLTLDQRIADLTRRLWPAAPVPGAPPVSKQARAEASMLLELVLRERSRRVIGNVGQRAGARRYEAVSPRCLFDNQPAPCHTSADLIMAGYTNETPYRAAELLQRACEHEDPDACTELKWYVASLAGQKKTRDDSGRIFSKMCLRGDAEACEALQHFEGGGWASALVSACGKGNGWACTVVVAHDKHWVLGRSQRDIGFWVMIFGTPLAAGIGFVVGLYAGLATAVVATIDGQPSIDDALVAVAIGTSAGALIGFGIGFGLYMAGRSKAMAAVDRATEFAAKHRTGAGSARAPPVVPIVVVLRSARQWLPGLGLAIRF